MRVRNKFKKSGLHVRVQAILVLLVLLIQYTSTIPINISAINEPLIGISAQQSFSKQFVRDPWFGKTDNNSTFTITLYPNATLVVDEDKVRTFVFTPPKIAVSGAGNVARANSTHYVTGSEGSGYYLHFLFLLRGKDEGYKFSACWNIPQDTSLNVRMSGVNGSRFANNIFHLHSGLKVNWTDAVAQGYPVGSFTDAEGNIYAQISVPRSGCLDPVILHSGNPRDALVNPGSTHTEFALNRWWAFYWDGSNLGYRASAIGGSTESSSLWTAFTALISCSPDCYHAVQWNGTHFHLVIRDNHATFNPKYRQCKPFSNGSMSCGSVRDFASGLSAGGVAEVIVRSDGIPFGITRSACCTPHNVSLYQANDHVGSSWTPRGVIFSDTAGVNPITTTNMSDNRIMIIAGSSSLRSMIFYKVNSSFGNPAAIDSTSGQASAKAVSDRSGVAHLIYRDGGTSNVYYARYSGGSWSSATLVSANAVASGANVGITLRGDGNTLALFHYQTNKMVWNMTIPNLGMHGSGVVLLPPQTGFDYLSSSDYANSTGYVGVMWKNGTKATGNDRFRAVFQTFKPTTWGTDIVVMDSSNHEREPHTVASTKSNTLVAVAIQTPAGGSGACATKASTNGGDSWSNPSTIPQELTPNSRSGDPAIATNSTGGFIMVCGEWGNPGTPDYGKERIYTYSSADGISWTKHADVAIDDSSTVFLDKPWIAVDSNQSSPFKNHVYVCWTQFHGNPAPESTTYTQLMFKRVSPNPTSPKVLFNSTFIHGSQIGCNMAIGTNGELYVPWFNYQLGGPYNATLQFRWNDRGGEDWGWGRIQNVTSFRRFVNSANCLNVMGIGRSDCLKGTGTTYFRIGFMPGLAVDMKGGVHMVYAENVTTGGIRNGDIKYVNSDDCRKGSRIDRCSWNTPITINLDTSNRDQFMPTIHVSNITSPSAPRGVVYVTALDRRNDASNVTWQVWSYTCPPGANLGCRSASEWGNQVVSDVAAGISNQGESFIGDYNGIAHTKTREAYPVWVDNRQFASKGFDIYGDWSKR